MNPISLGSVTFLASDQDNLFCRGNRFSSVKQGAEPSDKKCGKQGLKSAHFNCVRDLVAERSRVARGLLTLWTGA